MTTINHGSSVRPSIFLDLDGVCCDFLSGLARLYSRKLADLPVGIYDLPALFDTTFEDVDARIRGSENFWLGLSPYPHAKQLVQYLQQVGDVFVLSSPWPQDAESHAEKLIWADNNLGIPHDRVILTPHKSLLAAPGRILIDDLMSNCRAWVEHGGDAVHFPTHHNQPEFADMPPMSAVEYVERCFAHLASVKRKMSSLHANN